MKSPRGPYFLLAPLYVLSLCVLDLISDLFPCASAGSRSTSLACRRRFSTSTAPSSRLSCGCVSHHPVLASPNAASDAILSHDWQRRRRRRRRSGRIACHHFIASGSAGARSHQRSVEERSHCRSSRRSGTSDRGVRTLVWRFSLALLGLNLTVTLAPAEAWRDKENPFPENHNDKEHRKAQDSWWQWYEVRVRRLDALSLSEADRRPLPPVHAFRVWLRRAQVLDPVRLGLPAANCRDSADKFARLLPASGLSVGRLRTDEASRACPSTA